MKTIQLFQAYECRDHRMQSVMLTTAQVGDGSAFVESKTRARLTCVERGSRSSVNSEEIINQEYLVGVLSTDTYHTWQRRDRLQ